MDDRIKTFLEELKADLAGFPDSETKEAVEYYEEYINDALDEGESLESILSHLDPPEKIAAVIMSETSIRKAQKNPGLKNYSKVLKYSRALITKPFSILLFSIFILVTYSTALLLFLSAIVSAAAACVILPGSIYEAFRIPAKYMPEILGTVGFGLFTAMLCLLLAIGLYKLCSLFIWLSTSLVGRMLNRPGKKLHEPSKNTANEIETQNQSVKKVRSSGWALRCCLIALTAGLVLSLSTGLPVKLFMIFNSMKPANTATQEWEYDKATVKGITISTAHSHIRLVKGNTDKIKISYEQPDWMEPKISCIDGKLSFSEISNGRLPLFEMVSIHENNTDVVLTLPDGFEPESLKLESRGGFIYIETADFNIEAETYTGSIFIDSNAAKASGINAVTSTGIIQSGGQDTGIRTGNGLKYERAAQGGKSIKIKSSRGSVFIE